MAHSDGCHTTSTGVTPFVTGDGDEGSTNTRNRRPSEVLRVDYYKRFLSILATEKKPSPIRSLFPLESRPGLISLLAGKPNAATFPISSITFTAESPSSATTTLSLSAEDLAAGLQYGATSGLNGLCQWVEGLQEKAHGRRKGEGWRVSVGSGSQDLIYKAVQCLVNDGDPVLIESPTYAGVIPMFQSLHCELIEVDTDIDGICSHSLRSTLENWPAGKVKPKVLYTVPYGSNPTGRTATLARRKEVLALTREHDFIILEDDPYYYLYYGPIPRPPSYFALELGEPEIGRVLRFDSMSKILSAGIRIGFVSGPEALVDAMDMLTATTNLQTSSLTQALTLKLLVSWGHDGFLTHTQKVSDFYRQKRDVFEGAMRKYLSGESDGERLAVWGVPEAGMFYWFKLLLSADANAAEDGGDSEAVIRTTAVDAGVLALPGTVFLPNGRKTAYVRASFSLLGEDEVDEAIRRLREVVKDARQT